MTESMPVSTPQRSPKRISAGRVVVDGVLGFFVVFYLLPRVVMLLTSFKTMEDVRGGTILKLPETFTLEPWRVAWSGACVGVACVGLRGFHFNAILMGIPAAIISTPVGASNGYALTQFRFPRQRLMFGLMLLGASTP